MKSDSKMMMAFGWPHIGAVETDSTGCVFDGSGLHERASAKRDSSAPLRKIYETSGLFERYQFAKSLCEGVDGERLRKAFVEAVGLLNSGVFPAYVRPHVGVDEYGEFSFSVKTNAGYFDVGVNGGGEISFHVRNDASPDMSVYGDLEWDGRSPPENLIEGALGLLHV